MARGGRRDGAGRKAGSTNKLSKRHTKTLLEIAQTYEAEAIETLASIMRDTDAPSAARATCANSILDRARGKPVQSHEVGGKKGDDATPVPIRIESLTNAQLEQLIARIEAAVLGGATR